MTLNIFKNQPTTNIFNPTFEYYTFVKHYTKKLKLPFLKKFILSIEKDTIKKYKQQVTDLNRRTNGRYIDGHTGLGIDSLTATAPFFNLLNFKETQYLKPIIRDAHECFIKALKQNYKERLFVQCWANVIRKGKFIGTHLHGFTRWDYISGHITIAAKDTSTVYIEPFCDPYSNNERKLRSPDIPGKLTLFPSWVAHHTEKVKDSDKRITVAFDIRTQESWEKDVFDNKKSHWVEV